MFKLIALTAIFGFVAAVALESDVAAETKLLENEISPEGVFHYAYQTSNGIEVDSQGDAQSISGNINYLDPDGQPVHLAYTADENGFHPQGEHLPTSPPVPEAIARAIEWIEAHPPPPEPSYGPKL